MSFVFDPPAVPSATVKGEMARFPVRRIFCVGRNYAAHAKEMGGDPNREPPFFFTKPADALVGDGASIPYPPLTENLHFEAELVVAIGKGGSDIAVDDALGHVYGYAAGNDLTRRDLQFAARDLGRPWDWGKAFDNSAVCGPIVRAAESGHFDSGSIRLTVNGAERQKSDIDDLIWSVPEVISTISQSMRLAPGDLIFTGTPAGVGALVPGDVCVVEIERLPSVSFTVVGRGEA